MPDGVNISVEDVIVDTIDEAKKFMQFCVDTWGAKEIDLEECKRLYEETQEQD